MADFPRPVEGIVLTHFVVASMWPDRGASTPTSSAGR